jgi:hypothetical protein
VVDPRLATCPDCIDLWNGDPRTTGKARVRLTRPVPPPEEPGEDEEEEQVLRTVHFPGAYACAELNTAAVFHPQIRPGDEGLPCVEVAGIVVFAYLDADIQAVRISVHLDTTDERLLLSNETVPLHIVVEDNVVFSAGITPARTGASRGTLWLRRLFRRGKVQWPRGD